MIVEEDGLVKRSTTWRARVKVIGMVAMAGLLAVSGSAAAADVEGSIGPDVVVFELPSTDYWGSNDGVAAYSVGTTSCNRGDQPLSWISNGNQHPVIAQNLYRVTEPSAGPPVEHGKIEMLGISWLKHGFLSVNTSQCDTCIHPPLGGSQLGVGCADPYGAGLNGSQSYLGPRFEVNAFTGEFIDQHAIPSGNPTLAGRINVKQTELINDPATYSYFVEGHYIAPDDAASGNALNNASHREDTISGTSLNTTGATHEGIPAIYAWRDVDPSVTIREVTVPGEGLFIVAYKVGDNGNGTWRYQYSIFNLNSHLSGRSFTVPILPTSVVTGAEFRDVDYHSGEPYDNTDWAFTADPLGGWARWSSVDPDPPILPENANALRWSTMYSFGFDADSPPEIAAGTIGLFRSGGPSSIQVIIEAPAGNLTPLFADDFETGDTGGWTVVFP